MSEVNHRKLRMSAARRGVSMYKMLNSIMRHYDDSKFGDQHDTVVDQDTGEVSTVGKAEKVKAANAAKEARFKTFYEFVKRRLREVGGDDIVMPSVPEAKLVFSRVAKYDNDQIAGIMRLWASTDFAKRNPSIHLAFSTNSINQWVIANRKSSYFN